MNNNLYILKHCDIDVAEFSIDENVSKIEYLKIIDEKFSPVNSKANDIAKAGSFNDWLINRCIPNSREGVERLKKEYKLNDLKQIMFAQHGLSLSDHYWIEKAPYNNKWKDINLFENGYDEIYGKILFDANFKLVEGINKYGNRSPEGSTGGKLKKYWKYDKDKKTSCLIKSGSSLYKQEPFNEYFSSLLLKELNFEYTHYDVIKDNNEWVSICSCISGINTEMLLAEDIKRKYGVYSYEDLIKLAEQKTVTGYKDSLNKMIILDYLIGNTDRHWNNFGILRDSKTGNWIKTIPIFDNGYSLWNNDFVRNDLPVKNLSFKEYNEDNIELLNISDYIIKLPDMKKIFEIAFEYYENLDRKRELKEGINNKQIDVIKYIENKRN